MEPPPIRYTTTSDGKRLAYTVSGRGRPLVLVPNTFMHAYWAWLQYPEWFSGLAERFRFVHFNYRGQGLSTRGLDAGHSIRDWQRDLEQVMDAAKVEKAVLMSPGHAGHIALRFAIEHPERVAALILFAPALKMAAWPNSLMLGVSAENWEVYARTAIPRHISAQQLEAWERAIPETQTQAEFQIAIREIFSWDLTGELADLRVPALVVHTRNLLTLPVEESQRFAAALPDARFVMTDGESVLGGATSGLAAIDSFLAALPEPALPAEPSTRPAGATLQSQLTVREAEVLLLITGGRSNQQIANELVLSVRTVERHITNLYAKIGAHNKADATAYALRRGLA
jgi:pimeloyl-ACP methyl ester carboxylesterase/DNA-binding CsgD family transcriptional regulator